MNKKTIISTSNDTIHKLRVSAKKKEGVRSKLVVTAKKKEVVRNKLVTTAKNLAMTAKEAESVRRKLAIIAKEKEAVRNKLVTTAKKLAVTAKEAESVRRKLAITAKEKEIVRNKLVTTAKKLAITAEEAENVRQKLAITAKEKETVRNKLVTTAKELAITAKEAEDVRRKLAVTAKEKEAVRSKLETTAKKLAVTAEEAENVRRKLATTAKKLAVTAKEAESVRRKLAITAKQKEAVRNKLVTTAKKLAVTAKKTELINKELRSLDVAKDEFVSIASHQLRTPLTALKGYAGMLLDGDAGEINDKQREYLTEIKIANDRMISLITALLNVSRIDLDVFIVEPIQLNLKTVAEDVLKDLNMKIEGKKLQTELSSENNIPLINADMNIIRMIFQNLFANAVKYTPENGKIIINLKKEGPNVLITVADTGYGIPSKVQSKIFTKMFRADNARVKDPEGTGLGLYIIKSTLEKTGGKIWFKSIENKGSTFYVTIPLEGMKKKKGTKRLELK